MESTFFRTKTGYCHLLPDQLVFSKEAQLTDFSQLKSENRVYQNGVIYLVLIGFSAYWSWRACEKQAMVLLAIYSCIGVLCLVALLRLARYSDTAIVLRNRITGVQFRKAIPFVNYAQFVIHFTDENGRKRKRLILLPGKLNDQSEAQQAVERMEQAGYLSATA